MTVKMTEYPSEKDWMEVKRRALKTCWKIPKNQPDDEWKKAILRARHSPIRRLFFSFDITCPYWVSVHLVRHHVGFQPYVSSQRNDRQTMYDRNKAPQDAEVEMIVDLNAESLIELANKRLCNKASKETRKVVQEMCNQVIAAFPEFESELVPMCERNGGVCYEMQPCGKANKMTRE